VGERALFLYDGDCGLCQRTTTWLRAKDSQTLYLPWQRAGELADYGLTPEDVAAAAYLVESGNVLWRVTEQSVAPSA
jgi:predicted DCC family thiol-disulfide oxidoreductase YuxK